MVSEIRSWNGQHSNVILFLAFHGSVSREHSNGGSAARWAWLSLQEEIHKLVATSHIRVQDWKRLAAYDDIKRERWLQTQVEDDCCRPFKGLASSLEGWLQQFSDSLCVCEQFKEKETLKCNHPEGERSWSDDDKMLLVDLTSSTAALWWEDSRQAEAKLLLLLSLNGEAGSAHSYGRASWLWASGLWDTIHITFPESNALNPRQLDKSPQCLISKLSVPAQLNTNWLLSRPQFLKTVTELRGGGTNVWPQWNV